MPDFQGSGLQIRVCQGLRFRVQGFRGLGCGANLGVWASVSNSGVWGWFGVQWYKGVQAVGGFRVCSAASFLDLLPSKCFNLWLEYWPIPVPPGSVMSLNVTAFAIPCLKTLSLIIKATILNPYTQSSEYPFSDPFTES